MLHSQLEQLEVASIMRFVNLVLCFLPAFVILLTVFYLFSQLLLQIGECLQLLDHLMLWLVILLKRFRIVSFVFVGL